MKAVLRVLAAALLWVAAAAPALAYSGTLLFAGTEDIDFQSCTGTCTITTTAGRFRTTWSRQAVSIAGSTADPPTNYTLTPTFANQTTIWLHYQGYINTVATQNNAQAFCIFASDGNPAVCLRGTGTNGQTRIDTRNTSGTFATLVTCTAGTFPAATLQQIDFKLTYAAAGAAELFVNGSSVCSFSGDTTTNSRTAVNQVRISGMPGTASGNNVGISEIIVGTTDTTGLNVLDMYTTNDGNSVAWGGSSVCASIWNAGVFSDGSFASTPTNNLIHQCTVNSTQPSGTYNVIGTVQSARVLVGATGPQHFQFNTRTGGSDFNSADKSPTGAFSNFPNYIQTTNPNTTNPWAISDLTDANYNIGLKSTP